MATLLNFGQMPLVPVQLLWLNLVTDSLPALALGVEPVEEGVMDQPPRDPSAGLFSRGFSLRLAWQGLMVGGLTLGAYLLGLFHLGAARHGGGGGQHHGLRHPDAEPAVPRLQRPQRGPAPCWPRGRCSNPAMNKAFLAGMAMQLSVLLLPPLQGVFSVCAHGPDPVGDGTGPGHGPHPHLRGGKGPAAAQAGGGGAQTGEGAVRGQKVNRRAPA